MRQILGVKLRLLAPAVLCGFALVAGCSASTDYESNPSATPTSAADAVPHWIREAARLARATKAPAANTARSKGNSTTPGATPADGGLPPRDVAVLALKNLGLSDSQAGCVYDAVAANPQTAGDVAALLGAATPAPDTDAHAAPTTTVA